MKFPYVLRQLRSERRISQTTLADAIGVSRSAVGMYETGSREPDFETMETIADFFNVDMNYLYGKQTVPNRYQLDVSPPTPQITLTPHETALVITYREHPEMQPAVDKILGISGE